MRAFAAAALLLTAAAPLAAQVAPSPWKPAAELRLRWKEFATPAAGAAAERDYDFGNARLRLGLDYQARRWTFHGAVQGAAAASLPEAAAFGAGRTYYVASGNDADPEAASLLELSAAFKGEHARFTLGRQGFMEGMDGATGVEHLDTVKRTRLGERLVGNLDWTNVGRRFDGATFAWAAPAGTFTAFALRALSGAFSYDDPHEALDAVDVYGASYTFKRGSLLEFGELRVFDVGYRDDRAAIAGAAGGTLDFQTFGASLLAGDDANDLVLWAVMQDGSWGSRDQSAWAALAEAGHRWSKAAWKPWVRAGYAVSSGDASPSTGTRSTFFNLLPTNHKWYGAMDYVAFSNLTTAYAHLFVYPAPRLQVELALHRFSLTEKTDSWYFGSGPYDDKTLGYGARPGPYADGHVGDEIDLVVSYGVSKKVALEVGGGVFAGGAAAEQTFAHEADGRWAYAQLVWKP
jgi:hypothetical protein